MYSWFLQELDKLLIIMISIAVTMYLGSDETMPSRPTLDQKQIDLLWSKDDQKPSSLAEQSGQ